MAFFVPLLAAAFTGTYVVVYDNGLPSLAVELDGSADAAFCQQGSFKAPNYPVLTAPCTVTLQVVGGMADTDVFNSAGDTFTEVKLDSARNSDHFTATSVLFLDSYNYNNNKHSTKVRSLSLLQSFKQNAGENAFLGVAVTLTGYSSLETLKTKAKQCAAGAHKAESEPAELISFFVYARIRSLAKMAQLTNGKNFFNKQIGPPSCKIGNWVEEQQIWEENMRLIASGERQSAANAIKNPKVVDAYNYKTANYEIGYFSDELADSQRLECRKLKTMKKKTKPEGVTDYLLEQSLKDTRLINYRNGHDILNLDLQKPIEDLEVKPETSQKCTLEMSIRPEQRHVEVIDYRRQRKTGFW